MGAAVKQTNARHGSAFSSGRAHRPRSPIDKAKAYEVVWNQVSDLFDAARAYDNPSFVYFIGEPDNGPLKIGISKDPVGRLRTMQTGNPRRLKIEHVLLGDIATEKLLHEFWEPFAVISARSKGKAGAAPGTEWFEPEVRDQLLPIVHDAVARQLRYLAEARDQHTFLDLEQLIRDAHAESGLVARKREEVRLLTTSIGYAIARRSRI